MSQRALVAVEGVLGQAVALTLARGEPAWEVSMNPHAGGGPFDLVIVDESHPAPKISATPTLVLGRDLAVPFAAAALRRAAHRASNVRTAVPDDGLVAVDQPLCRAREIIQIAARRRGTILVSGPTGVGKEALARRFHSACTRPGSFIAINCAAISEGLIESTLFGHVRGAFTSAVADSEGAFQAASDGTLFLDEVGELDIRAQAKLLRALEEGAVRPVGSVRAVPVDVRIVAATNRELRRECEAGRFRLDLYFRLATYVIEIPALSARAGDLEALIDRFLEDPARTRPLRLSNTARARLRAYSWPGNARELKNVLERVLALARADEVDEREICEIAPELLRGCDASSARERTRGSLKELEEERIASSLRENRSRASAAEALGIHRTTLWRKMSKLKDGRDPR